MESRRKNEKLTHDTQDNIEREGSVCVRERDR